MDLNKKEFHMEFAGKPLTLSVSRMAEQANAAVMGQYGDTVVLVTAVMGKKDRKELDYFPLSVDYEEKFYAAGKILGSRFVRREGRPTNDAILSGRLIDRTMRPLFDQRMRRDVQIVVTILSYDEQNDPDFISLLTASTALLVSDIPWGGPVAGARVVKTKDGGFIINPTIAQLGEATNIEFDGFVSGTGEKINMIEFMGSQIKESEVSDSFAKAHEEIKKLVAFQKDIASKIGKEKSNVFMAEASDELKTKVREFLKDKIEKAIYTKNKGEQNAQIDALKDSLFEHLKEQEVADLNGIDALLEEEFNTVIQKNILEKELRPDSRKLDEIRDLYGEAGLFKRLHGSALFVRGGTQALAVTTLAAPGSEQLVETMESTYKRRFMLHYNFPPFSTGETGRMGGTGRREIGHGALAEKAIRMMIPTQDEFPYTIRVVSEVLSSNGSSSMATTCASSMSLMDAGVPIKKQVAGIAMGIVIDEKTDKYKILTDIAGIEDHFGGMDFKVAGTDEGINAVQLDMKASGLTMEMIKEVLDRAKKARTQILEVMNKVISKPREKVSDFAPVIMTLDIHPEQIGEVIGPGGKIINAIIADTGATTIDIEQTGRVYVAAPDYQKAELAIKIIEGITKEYEIGEIVEGPVVRVLDFGAIVDLGGGRDGMIHVSELKNGFVKNVTDVIKLGDVVRAKVVKIENGKIGLSLKAME